MHALTAITALPIGGSSLAAVATAGGSSLVAVASAVASQPPLLASVYLASSVGAYCVRRGLIHSRSDGSPLGPAEVLRRHLQHDGESKAGGWGKAVHLLHVFLWLAVFQPLYPLLELLLRPFDLAAFYFYYPRANGAGLVVDSLARRRAGLRGTKAQVFRLDWHRFELNVGERYPSPNPGRHKPSVRCNLPHVDLPQRNVRHWPWRQHLNDWVAATHEPVVQTHELRPDPKPNFLKLRKRRLLNFVRGARSSEQARARVA